MSNHRISTADLASLDVDKYLNWVFTQKAITRQQKKIEAMGMIDIPPDENCFYMNIRNGMSVKDAISRVDKERRTMARYRKAVGEVFFNTSYWKEPTTHEQANFNNWRFQKYSFWLEFLNEEEIRSPFPFNILAGRLIKNRIEPFLCGDLSKPAVKRLLDGVLPDNYYTLAMICGTIDFLKYLKNRCQEQPATEPTSKQNKKISQKAYALAYILDTYAAGKHLPTTDDGALDMTELMRIGESKGCTGDTFYRAVKNIRLRDLNNSRDLQGILPNWRNIILSISNDKDLLNSYLKEKKL
jgi:hypothetical protein